MPMTVVCARDPPNTRNKLLSDHSVEVLPRAHHQPTGWHLIRLHSLDYTRELVHLPFMNCTWLNPGSRIISALLTLARNNQKLEAFSSRSWKSENNKYREFIRPNFRNYITALNQMLYCEKEPNPIEYAQILSSGMSQPTTNLIASLYNIQPRVLLISQQQAKMRNFDQQQAIKTEQPYNQMTEQQNCSLSSPSEADSFSEMCSYPPSYYPHQFHMQQF